MDSSSARCVHQHVPIGLHAAEDDCDHAVVAEPVQAIDLESISQRAKRPAETLVLRRCITAAMDL